MKTKLMRMMIGLLAALACLQFHYSLHAQACATVTNGLVSWWKANNNAMDSVGTNHGRAMEGVGYAEGRVGRAFSFPGGRRVEIPHSASLSFGPTTPMSFEFWAYRRSGAQPQHFLAKRVGDCGEFNYRVYYHEGVVGWGPVLAGGALPLNTWTHLAGTFDGTNFRLFVNGQLAGTGAGTLGPVSTSPLLLGGLGCEGDRNNGLLDEVAIYKRALSADEVASIFLAGSAGKCGGLTFDVYDPPQWAISQEGGRVRFSMTGRPGDRYVVEATTDLSLTNVYNDSCECLAPTMVEPWSLYWLLFQDGSAPASAFSSLSDPVRFLRGRFTGIYAGQSGPVRFDRFSGGAGLISMRWLFTNDAPGLEQIIRLRAPTTNDPVLYFASDYFASGQQWTTSFIVYSNQNSRTFFNIPYAGEIVAYIPLGPLRGGEYQVEFLLRDQMSGEIVGFHSEAFSQADAYPGQTNAVILGSSPVGPALGSDWLSVSWLFTNGAPGLQPIIRLRTPGSFDETGDPLAAMPGTPPPNAFFYLDNDQQWTNTFTVFTNSGPSLYSDVSYFGSFSTRLPAPRRAGEYRLDFLLQDPVSGRMITFRSESFFYSRTPQMVLRLNRSIANSLDVVNAQLELLPGDPSAPTSVRIAAWLTTPSEEELSLPTITPGLSLLFDGSAQSTNFTLFSQPVVDFAPGDYRFEARMYDTNNALIGLATAPFMICDGVQSAITGAVYSATGQPLGAGAVRAVVRAYDMDDGGETTTAIIGNDGSFSLSLEAGHYELAAVVHDAAGFQETTNFIPLTVLCGSNNVSLSMTTAPAYGPPALGAAPIPGKKPAPPARVASAADHLPAARILIVPRNNDDSGLSRLQRELVEHFADQLAAQNPGVVCITLPGVQRQLEEVANRQRLGTDTAADADLLSALSAADFLMPLDFTEGSGNVGDSVSSRLIVVCDSSTFAPAQRQLPSGGFNYPDLTTFATTCSQAFGGLAGLRTRQCHPLSPYLSLVLSAQEIRVNQTLTATATLREGDINGLPIPDKTITFRYSSATEGTASAVTGPDGTASFTLPTQTEGGDGTVTAIYEGRGAPRPILREKPFRVLEQGVLTLSCSRAQMPSGSQVGIQLRLATLVNGVLTPRPHAQVLVQAENATIHSDSAIQIPDQEFIGIRTGADGETTFDFTAGTAGGAATVHASFTDPNTGQIYTADLTMNVQTDVSTALSATPTNLLVGSRGLITLDTMIGGARVAGLPVRFTLSGLGTLAHLDAQTDSAGQVNNHYSPPASGNGFATVTSVFIVGGRRYTNISDIYFTDTSCAGTTMYNNNADWSFTTNAPGQWRYGWVSGSWTPADWPNLNLYTSRIAASAPNNHVPGMDFWFNDSSTANHLGFNSGESFSVPPGPDVSTFFPARKMEFHPGGVGVRSVLRWIAPCAGRATVLATFERRVVSGCGGGVEFFVYHREQQLDRALVPGSASTGPALTFDRGFDVAAGDTVDFMVGPAGSEDCDTSGIDAFITLSPSQAGVVTIQVRPMDHACINELVTCRVNGAPPGTTLSWSGGNPVGSSTGSEYRTRFSSPGMQTVSLTYTRPGGSPGTVNATVKVWENSGTVWVPRFPGDNEISALNDPFRGQVANFLLALQVAGAHVVTNSVYRPPERQWLMHQAYRIASNGVSPQSIPGKAGVEINWLHLNADGTTNLAGSKTATEQMVGAYGIVHRPAETSRHTQRGAIDTTITWDGDLNIVDGLGFPITITTLPRHGGKAVPGGPPHERGNTLLHFVGRTYHVRKLVTDPPHWSDTGN